MPKPELLIVGRSPVAEIVSELGRLLEFKVCLADPQASKDPFPNVDVILTDFSLVRSRINEASFVVVATMGNADEEGLLAVVGTAPRYLGLVASEKKARSLFEYARDKGATDEQIALIKCPAGLELGGETMPEIALSVMAEITRVRRASESSTRSIDLPVMNEPVQSEAVATDPICGMTVAVQNARYTSILENRVVYFCCLRCKETFEQQNPQISQITPIRT